MKSIKVDMRFKLAENLELDGGIDNHTQIPDFKFTEWKEHPPQKFLNVNETFEFDGKTYRIDEIRTNLLINPFENVSPEKFGEESILYVYYYISEV